MPNLATLATIGSAIGGANTKVIVGSYTYCTRSDNGLWTISVAIGKKMSLKDMMLVDGYIDHEAGHIRETAWSCVQSAFNLGPNYASMFNVIEDVRMECRMSARYPGAAINLSRMVQVLAEDESFWAHPHSQQGLMSLVHSFYLYCGRVGMLRQMDLKSRADKAAKLLRQKVGEFFFALFMDLLRDMASLANSQEALELAKKIIKLVEECIEDQEEQAQQNQDQSGQGDAGDQQDQQDQDQSGQGDAGDQGDQQDQDPSGQGDAGDQGDQQDQDPSGQGDAGDQGDQQDQDQSGQGNAGDQGNQPDQGQSSQGQPNGQDVEDEGENPWVDKFGSEVMPKDLCDALAKAIDAIAAEKRGDYDSFNNRLQVLKPNGYDLRSPYRPEANPQVVQAVQVSMKKWASGLTTAKSSYHSSGRKVTGSRLAKVVSGNFRVFEHNARTKAPSAAVTILMDRSGSMRRGLRFIDSAVACASVHKALTGLPNFAVSVFQYNDKLHLIRDWDQSSTPLLLEPEEGTCTEMSVNGVIGQIAIRPETKKIIVVLTDGDEMLGGSVEEARQHGVTVVALRFGEATNEMPGLAPELQPFCAEMKDMPMVMAKLIQKAMGR